MRSRQEGCDAAGTIGCINGKLDSFLIDVSLMATAISALAAGDRPGTVHGHDPQQEWSFVPAEEVFAHLPVDFDDDSFVFSLGAGDVVPSNIGRRADGRPPGDHFFIKIINFSKKTMPPDASPATCRTPAGEPFS